MRKIVKDPEKEKAILQASIVLFGEKGIQAAKTEDIAKAAGVSKGLIFHYYSSKKGLFLAAYEYVLNFFNGLLDHAVWLNSTDLKDMVVNAMKYKLTIQIEYPIETKFVFRTMQDRNGLPKEFQEELNQKEWLEYDVTRQLLDSWLDNVAIKAAFTKEEVLRAITMVLRGEQASLQEEMAKHPEWTTMEDLDPWIKKLKTTLAIMEQGFLEED
ncbi:TetR family transcriptional regulator [Enterococcus florum]|uniref:TetR family transcriptional regulator n=1 Tax=Enterococcus florum TaxID=2480627 RepID=A0A4P5PCH2_9ENTE|nr:TetR/AcrR family transcriptional regulator [Enterococcus florum]GCF95526.1 TetR family transcriptional regulator [Enterococcus florum]